MPGESSSGLVAEVENDSNQISSSGLPSFDFASSEGIKKAREKFKKALTKTKQHAKSFANRIGHQIQIHNFKNLKEGKGTEVRIFRLMPSCSTLIRGVQFRCTLIENLAEQVNGAEIEKKLEEEIVICAEAGEGLTKKEEFEFGYACRPGRLANIELIVKYENLEEETIFGKFKFSSSQIGSGESFKMVCGEKNELTLKQKLGERVMSNHCFLKLNGSESFNLWKFDNLPSEDQEYQIGEFEDPDLNIKLFDLVNPIKVQFKEPEEEAGIRIDVKYKEETIVEDETKKDEYTIENTPFFNAGKATFTLPKTRDETTPKSFFVHLVSDNPETNMQYYEIQLPSEYGKHLPNLLPVSATFPDGKQVFVAYHCQNSHLLQVYKRGNHAVVFSPKSYMPFAEMGVPDLEPRYIGQHFAWYDMGKSNRVYDNCITVKSKTESINGEAVEGQDYSDETLEKESDEMLEKYQEAINQILVGNIEGFLSVNFLCKDENSVNYQFKLDEFQLERLDLLREANKNKFLYIFIKSGPGHVKVERIKKWKNRAFSFERPDRTTERCIGMRKFESKPKKFMLVTVNGVNEHHVVLPGLDNLTEDRFKIYRISKECFLAVMGIDSCTHDLEKYIKLYNGMFTKYRITIQSNYSGNIVHLGHKTLKFDNETITKSFHYSHSTNEIVELNMLRRASSYYNAKMTYGLVVNEDQQRYLYSKSFDCSSIFGIKKQHKVIDGPKKTNDGEYIKFSAEQFTVVMIIKKVLSQMDPEKFIILLSVISFIAVVITSFYF